LNLYKFKLFFNFFIFQADDDIAFINEVEAKFEKNLKDLPKNEITNKKNSGEIKYTFRK
jgi:hypothetical protein